jgi:hypothetical protein
MSIPAGECPARPVDEPEFVFELDDVEDFDGSLFLWFTR